MGTSKTLTMIDPSRQRKVPSSFAWLDHRLRAPENLGRLNTAEIGLYLFLVLAADRNGLSCWRLDRIERSMPCFSMPDLRRALDGLVQLGLVAYRPWSRHASDGVYQVLSLEEPRLQNARISQPIDARTILDELRFD